MKWIVPEVFYFTLFVLASGGCGQTTTTESELARLQGKWEIVACESQGMNVPSLLGKQYEFAGDRYRIICGPDSIGHWIKFELDVTKDPKQLSRVVKFKTRDKTVKERNETLIYRMNADELQICYSTLMTPTDPHPTDFSPKPYHMLLTLKRIPFANPDEERARKEAARIREKEGAFYRLSTADIRKENGKYVSVHGIM